MCLAIGLAGAAVGAAVVTWLLAQTGMSVVLLAVLFLVVWGGLFVMVDGYCASQFLSTNAANAAPIVSETDAAAEAARLEAEAQAAADAAKAAEEANAAEAAKAAEDAKAAEEAKAEEAAKAAEAAKAKAAEEVKSAEEAKAAEAARAAEEAEAAEVTARAAEAERAQAAGEKDYDGHGEVEGAFEGTRPEALEGPRDGVADDLKRIKGVGPKMEQLCNTLGFYHFDQIAGWTPDEVAWVDANLEGFKGRVTRDDWVAQAKLLAAGGETEFSKRVDGGDVPSSQ